MSNYRHPKGLKSNCIKCICAIRVFFNTDCWSLGCVLYELITLVKFHNRSRSTVDEIQTEISNLETSDLCKQLLVMMLQIDKANRAESYRLFKMFDKIN